jgi:hypothetical protein
MKGMNKVELLNKSRIRRYKMIITDPSGSLALEDFSEFREALESDVCVTDYIGLYLNDVNTLSFFIELTELKSVFKIRQFTHKFFFEKFVTIKKMEKITKKELYKNYILHGIREKQFPYYFSRENTDIVTLI